MDPKTVGYHPNVPRRGGLIKYRLVDSRSVGLGGATGIPIARPILVGPIKGQVSMPGYFELRKRLLSIVDGVYDDENELVRVKMRWSEEEDEQAARTVCARTKLTPTEWNQLRLLKNGFLVRRGHSRRPAWA